MAVALLAFVLKRLLSNSALVLSTALGLIVTVTLVTSIPLYSEGISEFLLKRELDKPTNRIQPASSVLLRHFDRRSDDSEPTTLDSYLEADDFFSNYLEFLIGLPEKQQVSYLQTDVIPILAFTQTIDTTTRRRDVAYGFVATMTSFEDNVSLMEGRFPTSEIGTVTDISGEEVPLIEASLFSDALDKAGLLVGDRVKIVFEEPQTEREFLIAIDLVGRVEPTDKKDDYWFYNVESAFDEGALFVNRDVYLDALIIKHPHLFYEATWYSNFDIESIRATNYRNITGGLHSLQASTNLIFPNTKLEISPERIFYFFDEKLFFLKLMLFILSAPVVAIILYFISLSAGMVVERQRSEISILKSRGVGTFQIIGIYLLEGLLIGIVAIGVGPPLAMGLAQVVGKTYTFLVFTDREALTMSLNPSHYAIAGGAVAVSVAATLGPAIAAARQSVVAYKQDVSRTVRRPLYQRFFLDFILLGLAGYGYYLLRQGESVVTVGPEGESFSDPLLIIIPVVFIFALSLIFLRIFPWLVGLLTWAGSRFYGPGVHLGLRQIGRSPGQFTRLILLLVLTFALGAFSASMARTLDQNLEDRVRFEVGADARFFETGFFDEIAQIWSIPPVEVHYEAVDDEGKPVFADVVRFWDEDGSFTLPGQSYTEDVVIYGVDPIQFGKTIWWRDDFAPQSLNALANSLATDERALLLDRQFFQEDTNLRIGDPVRLRVQQVEMEFFVAGWIDSLPTHYDDEGPFVVANLDYILRWTGETPWNVLARLNPGNTAGGVANKLWDLDLKVVQAWDSATTILDRRDDATQTGIFGILSVGFIISAVLTLLGFLMYSFISFRRRLQEFGILRAMGLSVGQMVTLFSFENGFLIALGTMIGAGLGILTGKLFIPFLQISADKHGDTPPFVVITAWGEIGKIFILFGIVLALAFPVSVWMLRRIRIHEAMKFGEETG